MLYAYWIVLTSGWIPDSSLSRNSRNVTRSLFFTCLNMSPMIVDSGMGFEVSMAPSASSSSTPYPIDAVSRFVMSKLDFVTVSG